jgi:hypothetical protein
MIVDNLTLKTPLQVCGPLICRSSDFSFDNAQCCGNLNDLDNLRAIRVPRKRKYVAVFLIGH